MSHLAAVVCAPRGMTIEEIIADVEMQVHSGSEKGWRKSTDTHFSDGQPNPCRCDHLPEERQHWLLDR